MKNIYTTLFYLLIAANIFAQPSITSSWAPAGNFGSNITITSNAGSHSVGASGANCIWNLTSWSSSMDFNSLDTCSFLPNNAEFPGTTDLTTESPAAYTRYIYRKLSGSSYKNMGNHVQYFVGDYDHFVWTNPIDILHFPVNYNDQFVTSGNYLRDWTYGSSFYSSRGSTFNLVSVDGYGVLNTPMGSFNNVLRIHTQENYTDSVYVSFQNWSVSSSSTDRYDWISPNKPGIIIASTSTTTNIGGTSYYSYYSHVLPTSTGIDELNSNSVKLSAYPQPASDHLMVNASSEKSGKAILTISDLSGRIILSKAKNLQSGINEIQVDVTEFSNGVYVLSVNRDETISTKKIVVCH